MPQDGKPTTSSTSPPSKDWREIAERASKEPDPNKLLQLIEELCDSMDRERVQNGLSPISPRKSDTGTGGNQRAG